MKIFKIIILILIIGAVAAGIYYKDDVVKFYNGFNRGTLRVIQNFQKTEIGTTLTQVGKEILSPPPLNIGGAQKTQVVLLQSKIIAETNLQRQENGNLPALTENGKLDDAASSKANDMFENQYFEHTSPSGVDPGALVESHGYNYIIEGENLILGNFSSEKEVLADWMASPGHRANILNNRYTEMGAAIIKGTYKGETVWIGVQEFGLPLSACSEPNASLLAQIDSNNAQLASLSSQITEKKSQIDSADSSSADYRQMIDDYNQLVRQYNSLAQTTKGIITNYNNQVNVFNDCVVGK